MNEKEAWIRGLYTSLVEQYEPIMAHLDGDAPQDKYISRNHQRLLDIVSDMTSLMDSIEAYADEEGVTL